MCIINHMHPTADLVQVMMAGVEFDVCVGYLFFDTVPHVQMHSLTLALKKKLSFDRTI